MVTEFNQYSRFIFFVKIFLGFGAGLTFIALFFFSSSDKPLEEVTVVTKDVKIGLKYQAHKARIKGYTKDGSAFDFYVKSLDPGKDSNNVVIISEPKGLIFFPNKERITFSADFASFNILNERINFKGNLSLEDSTGNLIRTEELIADFSKKILIGLKTIKTETPFGSINSGGLNYFYGANDNNHKDIIVFTDGINIEFFLDDKK